MDSYFLWFYIVILSSSDFKNIKQQDLNKHERNHINQAIQFASDNGCYCLNYTGHGKIFS